MKSYARDSTNYRPQYTPSTDPFSLEALTRRGVIPNFEPNAHPNQGRYILHPDPPLRQPSTRSHPYPFRGHGPSSPSNTMSVKRDDGLYNGTSERVEDVDTKSPHSAGSSWGAYPPHHDADPSHASAVTPSPGSFPIIPTTSSSPSSTVVTNIAKYGGTTHPTTGEWDYTSTKKFKICFLATCVNVVLFALDQLIITTAVPQIITEFQSTSKLAYLNSAFFIPCTGLICLYSQFLMIWRPKLVFLGAILIFEAGCAVCGGARSMDMLIAGRAIAGLGGAGMWSVTYIIAGQMIPLIKRPTYFAMFGLAYIFASVLGPVVGGALTDTGPSGWRWCFYINLPIGGVAFLLLLWSLPIGELLQPFDGARDDRPTWLRFLRLDWIGAALSIAAITCFAIGLQLAGVAKAWSDTTVIILLVMAPVSAIFFAIWTVFMGARAQVAVLMLKSRHLWAGLCVGFFGYGMIVNVLYYIPLLLEAVHGNSAKRAGVILIAYQFPMCFSTVLCGKMAERTGNMWIPMIAGSTLSVVASGILLLINVDTSPSTIAGFLVFLGLAQGCYINLMTVAVQADYVTRPHLIPHATAVQNWFGFIGRICAITTATSIFENKLRLGLSHTELSASVAAAVEASPGALLDGTVPIQLQSAVASVYASCIKKVWFVNLGFAVGCFVACLLLKRINIKDHPRAGEESFGMSPYGQADNKVIVAPEKV